MYSKILTYFSVIALSAINALPLRAEVSVGQTKEQVIQELGNPPGSMELFNKETLIYSGGNVLIENNLVTSIEGDPCPAALPNTINNDLLGSWYTNDTITGQIMTIYNDDIHVRIGKIENSTIKELNKGKITSKLYGLKMIYEKDSGSAVARTASSQYGFNVLHYRNLIPQKEAEMLWKSKYTYPDVNKGLSNALREKPDPDDGNWKNYFHESYIHESRTTKKPLTELTAEEMATILNVFSSELRDLSFRKKEKKLKKIDEDRLKSKTRAKLFEMGYNPFPTSETRREYHKHRIDLLNSEVVKQSLNQIKISKLPITLF